MGVGFRLCKQSEYPEGDVLGYRIQARALQLFHQCGVVMVVMAGPEVVIPSWVMMVILVGLFTPQDHANVLRPSLSPLDVRDYHLDIRSMDERRHGLDGLGVHQSGVEERRREHISGDSREALEVKGSHGHGGLFGIRG